MVYIKANAEIVQVYQKIISAMKERVEWSGDVIIRKNTMILVGRLRSMYFELSSRRVYSDIEEFNLDPENAFKMENNKLLTNIINMLLYPFGKWGAIKGLKVEQDYMVLSALFSQIFKEIDVETYFTKISLKFFVNGIQITFEDAMEKCISYIEKQREKKLEAENKGKKKDDVKEEKVTDDKNIQKKTVVDSKKPDVKHTEENTDNSNEKRSGTGLWHNMKWSVGCFEFKREKLEKKYADSHRIGNNFYMVPYECPECGNHLHMVVYPQRKENVIDTDEGRIYITRAYTCDDCKRFYTARPGKLLREGDAYFLDFDNDEYAARDYVQLLGKKGAKTGNCNFNMYEDDYERQVSTIGKRLSERCRKMELLSDEELEEILAQMDDGFFSDYEKERFLAIIEQELEYREKMRSKKLGEFGRRSDDRTDEEAQEKEVVKSERKNEQESEKSENEISERVISKAKVKEIFEKGISEAEEKEIFEKVVSESKKEIFEKEISKKDILQNEAEKNKIGESEIRANKIEKKKVKANKIGKNRISKKTEKYVSKERNTVKKEAGQEKSEMPDNRYEYKKTPEGKISQENTSEMFKEDNKNEELPDGKTVENNDKTADEDNAEIQKNKDVSIKPQVLFFDKIADESRTAKYSEIIENIKKVKASKGDEQEKNHYIELLTKLCKEAAKREIEYLLNHLPGNINFDRYKRTKEKLMTYTEIDVKPYIKIVDAKRDKVEFDELNKLVESVDRNNRNELLEMMDKIEHGEYEKRNSDRFVEGLRKRVYAMDESKLRGICPNPEEITFDEGIKALKEIEEGIFLPELKSNMLQLIDKKLTALKTEECELLVRKLQRDLDGKISDMSKIHFYDIRRIMDGDNNDKESSFIKVAISTYAYATGKYEYPIVICDSSMFGSGKEGFIITPDHVFYKGLIKSGSLDVKNINGVTSEKKGLMAEHATKGRVKLPCTLNKNDEKNMAEVLDAFIDYLKIKPESRSVEYMSKQEHKVKCCYRCGHVFTSGNICPKCGSRFDC